MNVIIIIIIIIIIIVETNLFFDTGSLIIKMMYFIWGGDRGSTVVKVAGSIPVGVSGLFIDIKFFRSHYSPGLDSASNRNEYQEYFLGVKAAGA